MLSLQCEFIGKSASKFNVMHRPEVHKTLYEFKYSTMFFRVLRGPKMIEHPNTDHQYVDLIQHFQRTKITFSYTEIPTLFHCRKCYKNQQYMTVKREKKIRKKNLLYVMNNGNIANQQVKGQRRVRTFCSNIFPKLPQ